MKDPIALNRADTGETVAWCCGECGTYCGVDETYAKYHCGGRPCEVCGKPSKRFRTRCPECIQRGEQEKKAKRIASALHISSAGYGGPVYWEEGDRYYADIDLAWDDICDSFFDNPEAVGSQTLWGCDTQSLTLCADDILEAAIESQEFYDGAYEHLSEKAVSELRLFCATWNDAHGVGVEGWLRNNAVIDIPDSWTKDFIEEIAKEKLE